MYWDIAILGTPTSSESSRLEEMRKTNKNTTIHQQRPRIETNRHEYQPHRKKHYVVPLIKITFNSLVVRKKFFKLPDI
jgi:hypothetical protein